MPSPRRIWPSMPKMSMASSIVSWCASDQNILLHAPSAAVVWVPLSTSLSVRKPLISMILIFDHERARRWRVERVTVAPPGARLGQDAVELLLEPAVPGRRRRPALEPERRHGDLPSVVHAADDVVLGTAHVGEEDLVELGGAVDLLDRSHLDTRLLHRHEQVRDAGVLGGVGIRPGQQEDVVGLVGLGRPHLLPVDHPLVPVELCSGLEPGQVRTGVRLAETLAPGDLPLEDAGYEAAASAPRCPTARGWVRRACRRRSRPAAVRRPGRTPRSAPPAGAG